MPYLALQAKSTGTSIRSAENAPGGIDLVAFKINLCLSSEADANKDGKITAGWMQDYLPNKSSSHVMKLNQKQMTLLVDDSG